MTLASVLGLAPVLIAVGLIMAARFWIRERIRRFFAQKDTRGRAVGLTPGARTGIGNLPVDAGLLAGIGVGQEAARSLDVRVMRPSMGLRAMSLGLGGLVLALAWTEAGADYISGPLWVRQAISGFVVYSMIYISQYEVRYDAHSIVAPDWFLRRRECRWTDLSDIRDDGHYVYKLRFAGGRKMEVQKYLTGIREFLTLAHDRVERCRQDR